jgi:glycosyltransferase involved in cell wall biosynthesis
MTCQSDRPRVSVIVPNYNHAPFLRERLLSILNQTYQDFELIVLDDASNDNSLAVIRECLAGRSHRLVVNEINSGSTFRQWDRGVSIARGEFVWIAESDDVAEITFLERLVAALDHGEAAYAYSQSLCIDAESCVFGNIKGWTDDYSPHFWASDFLVDGNFFCVSFLAIKCVIPNASAVLFRREFYQSPFSIMEGIQLIGDYLLWAELAIDRQVAYVASPLNRFRFHPGTVRMAKRQIYLQECIYCTTHILDRTGAWYKQGQLVFLRHHLLQLWLSIGLEPASPFNWWRNRKGYQLLHRLHGPGGLAVALLRAWPRSVMRLLEPLRLFIVLGGSSVLRRFRHADKLAAASTGKSKGR